MSPSTVQHSPGPVVSEVAPPVQDWDMLTLVSMATENPVDAGIIVAFWRSLPGCRAAWIEDCTARAEFDGWAGFATPPVKASCYVMTMVPGSENVPSDM